MFLASFKMSQNDGTLFLRYQYIIRRSVLWYQNNANLCNPEVNFKRLMEGWAKVWFSFKYLGIFAVFKDQTRASLKIWGRCHPIFYDVRLYFTVFHPRASCREYFSFSYFICSLIDCQFIYDLIQICTVNPPHPGRSCREYLSCNCYLFVH